MDASPTTPSPFLPGTRIQFAVAEAKVKELISKAIKVGDCWECHLAPTPKGYCYVSFGRANKIRVNRLVLFVIEPFLSAETFALHSCDNRRCIRPDHIFGGTAQDNTNDMMNKGRNSNRDVEGSHIEVQKIHTGKWIRQLLDKGYNGVEIAQQLRISTSTVSNYVNPNGVYHAYLR